MTELLHYRFGFDPATESPVFTMMGIPNKLQRLDESGVLEDRWPLVG